MSLNNYTEVTIVTENVDCNYDDFLVYGGNNDNGFQGDDLDLGDRIHFLGDFKELTLESYIEENGQNKCVFRTECEDCFYIIISVFNILDDDSAKICEVEFD